MNHRVVLVVLIIASCTNVPARGRDRSRQSWRYQALFDKADLVVIAHAVDVEESGEREKVLDGIQVVGVTTSFKVELVLKGKRPVRVRVFHYRRLKGSGDVNVDGPELVEFTPKRPPEAGVDYLLFLKQRNDGRYEAVSGQVDPADSVRVLMYARGLGP